MAEEPRRFCGRCGRIVRGVCVMCRREKDRARPSAAARGYDTAWHAYSVRWLAAFPWCGQRFDGLLYSEHSRCAREGRRERATCTDHIVAMKAGGAKFDARNHQSLCGPCNSRKNIAHEGGFGR